MDILSAKAEAYRQWMLEQHVAGCTIEEGEGNSLLIKSEVAAGAANFYVLDGETVVELRLESLADEAPLFFLHFDFDDEDRAKKFFIEMLTVLDKHINKETAHVLLCCTCGMTTSYFAFKLNEIAQEQNLPFDFTATSVENARKSGLTYSAVLLAPQVGYELKNVREALPGVTVIELPGNVFGAYDANAVIRLLLNIKNTMRTDALNDLRIARDYDRTKSVLSISYVLRADEPTLSYLVLDKGEEVLHGMTIAPKLDLETSIEDILATLRVAGYTPQSFDAIGVAVPGNINEGGDVASKELHLLSDQLVAHLSTDWGVPVFVDNNATAAAAGCYVTQDKWDDIVFHAQPIGIAECDEGYVLGGLTRTGNLGFAGSMYCLAKRFKLSMDLEEAVCRYDGTRELVASYLAATICTVAPDAVFVWCDFFPNMSALREELAQILPEEAIPELIPVSDYDKTALIGEVSLCLQRLVDQPDGPAARSAAKPHGSTGTADHAHETEGSSGQAQGTKQEALRAS